MYGYITPHVHPHHCPTPNVRSTWFSNHVLPAARRVHHPCDLPAAYITSRTPASESAQPTCAGDPVAIVMALARSLPVRTACVSASLLQQHRPAGSSYTLQRLGAEEVLNKRCTLTASPARRVLDLCVHSTCTAESSRAESAWWWWHCATRVALSTVERLVQRLLGTYAGCVRARDL